MPPMTPPTIAPIGVELGLSGFTAAELSTGGSKVPLPVIIGGVGEVVVVVGPAPPSGALVGS